MNRIDFEGTGNFITAWDDSGKCLIRCNFSYTDCLETDPLPEFIARHGGFDGTVEHLKDSYRKATV